MLQSTRFRSTTPEFIFILRWIHSTISPNLWHQTINPVLQNFLTRFEIVSVRSNFDAKLYLQHYFELSDFLVSRNRKKQTIKEMARILVCQQRFLKFSHLLRRKLSLKLAGIFSVTEWFSQYFIWWVSRFDGHVYITDRLRFFLRYTQDVYRAHPIFCLMNTRQFPFA